MISPTLIHCITQHVKNMKTLIFILLSSLCGMAFAQCPGIPMQSLPFGGVEVTDSVTSVSDSVCGFGYPCDSGQFYGWFSYQDTFFNGAEVVIESSRSDSASILIVTGCNTILHSVCDDIDLGHTLFIDHLGGTVSVHVAIPNPAKVTVRVQHAQQPTQPPTIVFPYSCNPMHVENAAAPYRHGMRVYYLIDAGRVIIK
jgi:hypothetical protein